jgi:hypothetical protein
MILGLLTKVKNHANTMPEEPFMALLTANKTLAKVSLNSP